MVSEDDRCRFKGCKNPPVTNTYFCDPHLQVEKEELLLELAQSHYADCVKKPERYSNYDLLRMLNYPLDAKGIVRCSNPGCDEWGYQCDERWRCKECSKEVIFCKEDGCNVRMDGSNEGENYCDIHRPCRNSGCKFLALNGSYFCESHLYLENSVVPLKPEKEDNICVTTGCNEWKCRGSDSSYCWKHTFKLDKEIDEVENPVVNHPPHYTTGKIETIDVITDWDLNYCEGNVIKYLSRYKHKGEPLEDLKKAEWYLKRLIKEIESAE